VQVRRGVAAERHPGLALVVVGLEAPALELGQLAPAAGGGLVARFLAAGGGIAEQILW
jgi:hypothetical protein